MYFERLLDDAHNELVRQAEVEEVSGDRLYLLSRAGGAAESGQLLLGASARAAHHVHGAGHLLHGQQLACEFSRAILERALEGNPSFLRHGGRRRGPTNRAIENMEIMHAQGADKDKFFYCNLDIPYSDDEDCVEHICEQVSRKILKPMRENYGVDTSDAAIRAAVSEHNEVCRILTEIGETRKLDNPPITGYEYAVLVLVSYVCPKRLILPLLRETLAEVKTREVDAQKNYKARRRRRL